MIEKIIYPDWISKKMCVRFDNLSFIVDATGFLYSQKVYNKEWDFQTKAFWLRSIGVGPERIAEKLNLNVNTLKNKEFLGLITLDYEGKNYRVKNTSIYDWSTIGFTDDYLNRHVNYGGAPEIPDPQLEMDGELTQILHDVWDDRNHQPN